MQSRTVKGLLVVTTSLTVAILSALLSSGLSAQAPANPPAGQPAQIEKGRQVVMTACAACHPTIQRMIQSYNKQTPQQWRNGRFSS